MNQENIVKDPVYFFRACVIYSKEIGGASFEKKFVSLEEAKAWVEEIYRTKKVSFIENRNSVFPDNNFCHFFGGAKDGSEWRFKNKSCVWEKVED